MTPSRLHRGFSLVEVVLALGVFGLGMLALAALMGTVFARTATEQSGSNSAQVMALVNQWLCSESRRDFARLQEVFLSGDSVVVWLYAWDAGGAAPEWKVMESAEVAADFARYQEGMGGFASTIFRVECVRYLAGLPAGAQSEQFSPLRVSVSVVPVPDPAGSFSDPATEETLQLVPGWVFFSMFRP